jgi:hypothetical protein
LRNGEAVGMSEPTNSAAENPYGAPAAAVGPALSANVVPHDAAVRELFTRGKNGAAWFYWIAVLSLINSAMVLSQGGITFALGLTVTMIADLMAARAALKPDGDTAAIAAAIIFDAVILGLFALCGRLSQRRMLWIYALGMLLYLLDGLLCLAIGMKGGLRMSLLIHGYALWSMWSGFWAYRQLNVLERQMMTMGVATPGSV